MKINDHGECEQCKDAVELAKSCAICEQKMRKPDHSHHLEISPIYPDRCIGCWLAGLAIEEFLLRAGNESHMGDWSAGWLREIIKEPWRYLK